MGEQVLQGNALADLHGVVRPLATLGKLLIKRMMVFGVHPVSEGLEEATHKLLTATAGHDGNPRSKRQFNTYKFRAIFAVPSQRGVEYPSDGDTHEGRSHIGTIIDILIQHPALAGRSASSPDESNRINIQ
jgi:hypothetical protein